MATEQDEQEKNCGLPAKLTGDNHGHQGPTEHVSCHPKISVESAGCGPSNNQRKLGRGARNTARGESPQPKWFTSMMDNMYGSMDVIGRQIEDLLSSVQDSDTWHRLRKKVADSYARIGREAVERRKGPLQGNLARVDSNMKELQGTVALTARNIFQEVKRNGRASEKSEGDDSKDVQDFVDSVVDELIEMRRRVLDATNEHFLADSVQLSQLNLCVQGLVPSEQHVHSTDVRDEINFYRILKEIPPAFVVGNQTNLLSASFAEMVRKTEELQQVFSLHEAMRTDENLKIKDLITKRADVNRGYHPDHEKLTLTPLCYAVALNSPEIIELLLRAGAHLSCKPSPIFFAHELGVGAEGAFTALAQHAECLRAEDITVGIISKLAKANADINFADEKGQTALHHWTARGNVELVTALVENGAQLDKRDADGKTPFDLAAELPAASEELFKVLEYVELHFGLGGEQLALSRSVLEDPPDVVDFLSHFAMRRWSQEGDRVSYFCIVITAGDRVAKQGSSWQSLGKPKVLWVTLRAFREDSGLTQKFLRVAGQIGTGAHLQLRGHLENFQDPNVVDEWGKSAFHKAAGQNNVIMLEDLYSAGARVDQQDKKGRTPLFISSQNGCLRSSKFFVEQKAKIDLPSYTWATPLYVASQNGHLPVVDFLLDSRADPNSQTVDLDTPLATAVQAGLYDVVHRLIQAKSDLEMVNREGETALIIALKFDRGQIAKLLLDSGASIDARRRDGASALDLAKIWSSETAKQVLIEAYDSARAEEDEERGHSSAGASASVCKI